MILGKFLPPHRGHQFLVDFARHYVRQLTVLVCTLDREPIAGDLRYRWMCEMFPHDDVRIVHVTEDLPQEPADHADFWNIWKRVVTEAVGGPIDLVLTSEDYGDQLSRTLNAESVVVDRGRELMPISGTMIREDPMRHWAMLPECVRPHYVKRVCITGPESTGKSTLTHDLACHYNTTYAWEYARPLLDPKGGACEPADIDKIAVGQLATEDAMARQANRVLFCDTNALLTTVWSRTLFRSCPAWIDELARSRTYDLTLLLDTDVPWVDDDQRYFPDEPRRRAFFNQCVNAHDEANVPYTLISGDWDQRFAQAVEAVDNMLVTT